MSWEWKETTWQCKDIIRTVTKWKWKDEEDDKWRIHHLNMDQIIKHQTVIVYVANALQLLACK